MLENKSIINTFEVRHYNEDGMPCFCHFGYLNAWDPVPSLNWHRDIEIALCTGGAGEMDTGDSSIRFDVGDILVANSGVPHRFLTDSRVEYWFLILDPQFCVECGYAPEEFRLPPKLKDEALTEIYKNIVRITHSETEFRSLKTRLECSRLLLCLFERYADFSEKNDDKPYVLHAKKVVEYLRYNYPSPISVDAVAEYVGINRTRLAKEFKLYTGQTILEQLNYIRCKNAKLLIENRAKIAEAAARCGFDNLSYFTRTYKRYFRELPSQTRKRVLSGRESQ